MFETINERISVLTKYDKESGNVVPVKIKWQGRVYNIQSVSYYHKLREGRNIQHIFHVTDGNMDFKLKLNSETLHWSLIEITDGN